MLKHFMSRNAKLLGWICVCIVSGHGAKEGLVFVQLKVRAIE